MAVKVTEEERLEMQELYVELRDKGYTKSVARQIVSDRFDRGLTTVWDNTYMMDVEQVEEISSKPTVGWPKTFIISAWEIRVKPCEKFIACLEQMADYYDAELILVPLSRSDARYIPQYLKDKFHVVTSDIEFNENLRFRYIETNALIQSPLSGHSGAYPDTTCIIPGLIKELRTEPSQTYVKQLISTGSIGYLNATINEYPGVSDDKDLSRRWHNVDTRMFGKPTAIAQNYVVPSALIVDVLSERTFLTRFVSSYRSGIVYDLNKRFSPGGYEESAPAALNLGDTHALNHDEEAIEASKEMIQMLNPKEVILNDFWDGESANHHTVSDPVKFNNVPTLREEAEITKELLTEICNISNKVTYLNSNHCNFLTSFLSGPQQYWRLNYNYELACELQLYRLQTGKHPIIKLLDLDSYKNLKFISEKDSHYVGKVLVRHGHEGVKGMRVGFLTSAKVFNFYLQSHLHSPAVFRNAAMAGLTCKLRQSYNSEAGSDWLHSNVLVQPDNSLQVLSIIRGVWIK